MKVILLSDKQIQRLHQASIEINDAKRHLSE